MQSVPLRQFVNRDKFLVARGVYDGLTAAMVRDAGFHAAYMSGAAVAATAVGHPDIGLATMTEMAGQAAVINRQLRIPLIADADTGFGDVINTVRPVQEYERAGVAAIQREDQIFRKRCGHLSDKRVVDAAEFAEKIRASVEARQRDTLIIARTDALANHGFDDAIRRAHAYVDAGAGADLIFGEAPQTLARIAEIPRLVGVPAVFNLVPSGKTPGESGSAAGLGVPRGDRPGSMFGAGGRCGPRLAATPGRRRLVHRGPGFPRPTVRPAGTARLEQPRRERRR
jgi:2-methylisocitrate lyase-like PEP mutase family enzyme